MPRSGLKGPSPSPSYLLAGGEREWGGACPRAPAPLVPQPSSGAAARIRGPGVAAAPLPRAFFEPPGPSRTPWTRVGGGQRGQGRPLQREPSGDGGGGCRRTRDKASSPPGARRRVCERRGPAGRCREGRLGPGLLRGRQALPRPVERGTSRRESGPRRGGCLAPSSEPGGSPETESAVSPS